VTWLSTFYNALPEWAKQSPVIVVLLALGALYLHGDIMSTKASDALRAADKQLLTEVTSSRDEFKSIAYNCTGIVVERAQQSAAVNDKAAEKANASEKKPIVATVNVPITTLTAEEKKSVEKPKDAEPSTLQRSLDASQKVLKKEDIRSAEVKSAQKEKP
jgi:hypothetical protein